MSEPPGMTSNATQAELTYGSLPLHMPATVLAKLQAHDMDIKFIDLCVGCI